MSTLKRNGVKTTTTKPSSTRTTKAREASSDRNTARKEATKIKATSRTLNKTDEEKLKKNVVKTSLKSKTDEVKLKKTTPTPKLDLTTSTRKVTSNRAEINKSVNAKLKKNDHPVTPPSSRVTKVQYFPSKKLYSNALKEVENSRRGDTSPDSSSVSERPRTATLRKGSIVNNNIVGPGIPKSKVPKFVKPPEPEENYEDDFESYESDFEEYKSSDSTSEISTGSTSSSTSTESFTELKSAPKRTSSASTDEERKLDSGNYELPDSRHRQILDNIKETIEKENQNNRSNLGSLSDEGFEDAKSLQFINFLGAKKKYQHRKSIEKRRRRGEEILSMIKLDTFSFTLFDLSPVPYDEFIKSFGKSNCVQTSVQTGDDCLNEEVQTEAISMEDKWTQFPPSIPKMTEDDDNFWQTYKCNFLGVGGNKIEISNESKINEVLLEKFLLNSGNLILDLQTEENTVINQTTKSSNNNIPFSKSCILFQTQNNKILKKRPIKDVTFTYGQKIVMIHDCNEEDDVSMVSIWSLNNVEEPAMLFCTYGKICCCSLGLDLPNLIFGGLEDGTIAMWDIKEKPLCQYFGDDKDASLMSSVFATDVDHGHLSKIVSIQSIFTSAPEENMFTSHKTTEVCSLDEDGELIVWSVVFKERNYHGLLNRNLELSWGSVILVINTRISLKNLHPEIDDFKCTAFAVSPLDPSHAYISTNYGVIFHCLTNGTRPSVKKLLPNTQTQANCLEMCPFSPQYVMAGFDNGDINLYSRLIERPIMTMSNKDSVEGKAKVEMVQWSFNRPFLFYTKDVTNTVHVWNLKICDLFPIHSIPFKEKIIAMKLSPVQVNGDISQDTFMIIVTENGSVYMHTLDNEHGLQSHEELENDISKFSNYVSRYV